MPRVTLTAPLVRSLKGARGRRVAYHDTVMPALELRITSGGVRSWSVRTRLAGRQIRVSLGRVERLGLADAREAARDAIQRARRGEDPRRPRAGRPSVKALAEAALERLELREATRTRWTRLLKVEIAPAIGRLLADQLDRRAIRGMVDGIRSVSEAHAAFAFLRRCYSWGVEQELLRASPFVGIPEPPRPKASERVLSTDELRAVWLALVELEEMHEATMAQDARLGLPVRPERGYIDATRLLILTAARRGMVAGMRRSELEALDTPAARWIVPAARMKGKRDHVTPLSPQALAIVRRRLAVAPGEFLFPHARRPSQPMAWSSRFMADLKAMVREVARREVPPWRLHSLRHTVATHCVEDLGVSSEIVSLILAHRPPGASVTRLYLRAELLNERRAALTKWAAWVEALTR